jgi:hypothetical protein
MNTSLPNVKKPCKDCPFRKDAIKGWLGEERMREILGADSFVCHKTLKTTRLQCAGHMLIKGEGSAFVQLAGRLGIELQLSGREEVFEEEGQCIEHHGL